GAVDLAKAVGGAVDDVDAPLVRVKAVEALLGFTEAELVDVAERDAGAVGREGAPLPEVLEELLALVFRRQLEEGVALERRDDRLDVTQELAVALRQLGEELPSFGSRERLVRDEDRRLGGRVLRRNDVRHGEARAFGEASLVVDLAPADLLHRRLE